MSNKEIIQKFIDGATSGNNLQQSLIIKGDSLYSYGVHYELARRVKNSIWVNSKESSITTRKQASMVRSIAIKNGLNLIEEK